ncbi:unnamed protein product [Dicrocoelium dendriticum]|nr:unnamed protein product [Dicrocoelium dendriticum]
MTTVSGLNESHNDEVTKTISIHTDCLKSSPSEESLWWYHPTKQNRKRKSRAASFPYSIEDNAKLGSVTRFSGNRNDTKFNEVAESSDVMEYACPASCEGDDLTTCLKSPPFGFERFSHSSDRPDASNLTMASELAWDRDLLKLSHERLVAYFADMKESTA